MEARTDHSTSKSPNLDNPESGLERSRFLSALGFGRAPGEADEESASSVASATSERSDDPGPSRFPFENVEKGSAPREFEPLDKLEPEESSETSPPEGSVTGEAAAASGEGGDPYSPPTEGNGEADSGSEETQDSLAEPAEVITGAEEDDSAHDADGLALRGDEGGPDFLASFQDMDDWEKDLMIEDTDETGEAPEPREVPTDHQSDEPAEGVESSDVASSDPESTGSGDFSWMQQAVSTGDDATDRVEADLSVDDGEPAGFSFLLKNPGGEGRAGSAETSNESSQAGPLDFETFSQRLKSAPLWKASGRTEASVPPGSGGSDFEGEVESSGHFSEDDLLVAEEPERDFRQDRMAPADSAMPAAVEVEPEVVEAPLPAANAAELASGLDRSSERPEDREASEAPAEVSGNNAPEVVMSNADSETPSPNPENLASGSPDLGSRGAATGEPAQASALAPAPSEIIDIACPECRQGLSLRREHLGIAGHCVWCQAPLVAAISSVDGVARVFLLKPGARPAEENRTTPAATVPEAKDATVTEKESTGSEPRERAENASQVQPEAPVSPWSTSTDEAPASPSHEAPSSTPEPSIAAEEPESELEEGETVEPEVLGSVEDKGSEPAASSVTSAWEMPKTDGAANLWAERAAAVQQSLSSGMPGGSSLQSPTGEGRAPSVGNPSLSKSAAEKGEIAETPVSSETPKAVAQAFSWMDPKPAPGSVLSDSENSEPEANSDPVPSAEVAPTLEKEEPALDRTEGADDKPQIDASSASAKSGFEWKPPVTVESEPEKPDSPKSESDSPFAPPISEEPAAEEKAADGETSVESEAKQPRSPFDWKSAEENEASEAPRDEVSEKPVPSSNDPFAGISAALEKAAKAEGEAPSLGTPLPGQESDSDESEPFENLSKLLLEPESEQAGPFGLGSTSSPTPDKSESDGPESGAGSSWTSGSEKKKEGDPFAAGFANTADAEIGPEAVEPVSGKEGSAFGDALKSPPLAAGKSLFSAGLGGGADPKTSPASLEDGEETKNEVSQETGETTTSDVTEAKSAKEAETETVEPEAKESPVTGDKEGPGDEKEDAPVAKETKKEKKQKQAKPKKERPETSGGRKSGLIKLIFWILVAAGLLAGIAAAALMRDRISGAVMPRLQPLLEKVLPAKEVEEDSESSSPKPPVDSSPSSGQAAANTDVPLPEAMAEDSTTGQLSSSTPAPPSVTTGSVRASTEPAVIPVPEKKSLFGNGPLLIHDGGNEEPDSSSE